ncbi:MAG TPA: 16S rRNA (adenine(1518)-N(6)/adenine(1519)-N(6))-dimethyltransferase RsmA [Thermoanaerobaculia bacterium]|jgi:16S rRNA (adenine1518-N6/adenine1519-N6)-dimethyltransferase
MPPQHDRRVRSGATGPPARKRWGQHFLARPETAERIVDAARLSADDLVLEVGPGDGALTRPLVLRAGRVVAVEIDPLRAERLREEFGGDARLTVLTGDVMQRTFREWLDAAGAEGPGVLVANLPYNAGTRILTAALEVPATIRRAVATVQAEVADRFLARPGVEGYGYLSVRTAAHATGRRLFDLPPAAFRPRPKVHSTVMELTPRAPSADAESLRRALRLASLGFQARRKTLANALSPAGPRAQWERALEAIGKTPRARAEELSLEDFVALARAAGTA